MKRGIVMAGAGAGLLLLVAAAGELAGTWSLLGRPRPRAAAPEALRTAPRTDATEAAPALAGREAPATTVPPAPDALPPPIDLAKVDRALDLHGVVVRANDAPVAGAALEAVEFPWRRANLLEHDAYDAVTTVGATRSASDGTFRIPLRRGTIVALRASAPGLAPTEIKECQPGQRLRVVLDEAVVLVVHAADPDGRDLPGTSLELKVAGVHRGVTDARGEHRFEGLPAGRSASLEASHGPLGGIAFEWRSIVLPAQGEERHEVVVRPGRVVTGRVTDARTGRPVAGARVGMGWTFFKETRTDDDGRYALGGWIGDYYDDIHVLARGYGRGSAKVKDGPTLDFALEPGFAVEGRIVGEDGRPLAGARVAAIGSDWSRDDQRISNASALAQADGRFRLDDLKRDLPHTLVAMADGFGRVLVRVPAPEREAALVEVGELRLPPGRRIVGVVRDAADKPLAATDVSLTGPRKEEEGASSPGDATYGRVEERETDDLGRFAFADLAPGSYVVSLGPRGDDEDSAIEVEVGASDVDGVVLRLRPARALRVIASDERGKPVAGAMFFLRSGGPRVVSGTTDGAGLATLRVPADAGEAVVEYMDFFEQPYLPVDAVAVPASQEEVRVVLRDAALVRGKLLDPHGAPIVDGAVEARRAEATAASTQTRDAGAFVLRVPPGAPVDVVFRGDVAQGPEARRRPLRAVLRGVSPGAPPVVLQAEAAVADRTLVVRVVTAGGVVVAGAEVRVAPRPDGLDDFPRTDAQGEARIAGLTPEPVRVLAMPPEGASGSWSRAQVEGVTPGDATLTLRLLPPRVLRGLAVDESGAPVPGATVSTRSLYEGAPPQVAAGDDGAFSIALPPDVTGPLSLHAFATREGKTLYGAASDVDPAAGSLRLVLRLHRGW